MAWPAWATGAVKRRLITACAEMSPAVCSAMWLLQAALLATRLIGGASRWQAANAAAITNTHKNSQYRVKPLSPALACIPDLPVCAARGHA